MNVPKIAIIMPAKGNPDVTIKALKTFNDNHHISAKYSWKIFHADTGSSSEDLNILTTFTDQTFHKDNFQLIEYDWYNFAGINNDVVANYVDDTFTHLLFCNNDLEFTCNILDRTMEIYEKNPNKIGTVGYRLLFPDGMIQHDGQYAKMKQDKLHIGHINFKLPSLNITYDHPRKVLGNTFACVMTEKKLFETIGGLSEDYYECYEDVQYNLECLDRGMVNLCLESKYNVIHYESLTRGVNLEKINKDYWVLKKFWSREK